MEIRPLTSFGLILSYKCSSRCRHCLYCCSSKWGGWMEPALIEGIFKGIRECGSRVRGVHLAGGEAFLSFPLLLEAVGVAKRLRVPIDYVETNGHWFTTRDDAVDKLRALKAAGLNCIMVSASPQHAEYIPFSKTLGAIEACREVFGSSGMFVWLPEFMRELAGMGLEGTLPWDDYARTFGEQRARQAATYGGQLVPGGRAGFRQAGLLDTRPAADWFGEDCEDELLHSSHGHYDLYGNILPSSCSGLTLGDAHDLPALCRDFTLDTRPIMRELVERGVAGLYELAEAEWGYEPLPGYAGKCHLCMDIRRHIVASGGDFQELAPRMLYEEI